MATISSPSRGVERTARRKRFLALGVVLILLGLAGAGASAFLELTSLLVFAPLLLASGVIQILIALTSARGKDRLLHLVAVVPEGALGLYLLADPRVGGSLAAWT